MAKPRKTKEEKALEAAVDAAFGRLGSGISFDVFDLSKICDETKAAVATGKTVDEGMTAAIAKYRQN